MLDEKGELAPLLGSVLPAGYQLDTTIPGRQVPRVVAVHCRAGMLTCMCQTVGLSSTKLPELALQEIRLGLPFQGMGTAPYTSGIHCALADDPCTSVSILRLV